MSVESELSQIIEELAAIRARFNNYDIAVGDEPEFKRLAIDAHGIASEQLGPLNPYTFEISKAANEAVSNYMEVPSQAGVEGLRAAVRAALNAVRRKTAAPSLNGQALPAYVDASRLAAIRSAPNSKWDLSRLAQLCKELNIAHANDCHMSIAMLIRTITNHVAPVFGMKNFGEVANNLQGEKSFKKSMQKLDGSFRDIADSMLHLQIRRQESLPNATQVDVRAELDRLLEEVVRRAHMT